MLRKIIAQQIDYYLAPGIHPSLPRSSTEIVSNKSGVQMVKESKMMASRWKIFQFTYEIADEDIKVVKPCGL